MATATVGRYVVVTEERYEGAKWRSECFVGTGDSGNVAALFREKDCSPPFDSPDEAARSALQRGVAFARSLGDPAVVGLLTFYS
ncbi:hypothetical protein [Paraburkholderia kirstenboschensis]|jgi:LPS sulfotransferase NodH|uniref:Uncharacterized protein n=1 Tax=Paraburkholderia kirstenboschensis TaxID=1245436 RepID=A0ABZ0EBV4_9BURK|nr:hypothetical protein [Paraburkholderia kirstenboschensis]WOD13985.1 hypothetical protein RW095_00080 [Paraburkholderia kirstenboschensis]